MIYLDNAATMKGVDGFFNINSPYARENKIKFEYARDHIGELLHIKPENIYFTSGGCEANSWALQRSGVKNIITTKIEHPSVMNCCKYLENHGCNVTYLDVNRYGKVNLLQLEEVLAQQSLAPTLVSIMCVNNELGTVQDLRAIRKIIDEYNILRENASAETLTSFAEPIYFHSDCVQAVGTVDIPTECLDMMSISGHKFGADYGVGFLYSRIPLEPLIFGGSQENGLRGGTSNYFSVIQMSNALGKKLDDEMGICHARAMVKYLRKALSEKFDCVINTPDDSKSSILSVSFKDVDAEGLMVFLSDFEIYVSAGSACHTDHKEPSHVLKAIGISDEYIHGTIRFSLSKFVGTSQLDKVISLIECYIGGLDE